MFLFQFVKPIIEIVIEIYEVLLIRWVRKVCINPSATISILYTVCSRYQFSQPFHRNNRNPNLNMQPLLQYCCILLQILEEERFTTIEKIKTTGASYMAASGLTDETFYRDGRHVVEMADYALSVKGQLQYVNQHSFNNFKMKIGRYCSQNEAY